MNSKNIIAAIVIAIIFAVGGYFIGKGALSNQNASIFKTASSTPTSEMIQARIRSAKVTVAPTGSAKFVDFDYGNGLGCDRYDNSLPNGLDYHVYWTHYDGPCPSAIVKQTGNSPKN